MTALLVVSIIALIVAFSSVVLSALISSRTISSTNRLISSMHERNGRQLDKTLDRLMTINWEQFAAIEAGMSPEFGYQSLPGAQVDEGDTVDQVAPDIFGRLRSIIDEVTDDEQELIDEDLAHDERERVET